MRILKLFPAALIVRHSYASDGFTIAGSGVVLGDASSGTLVSNDQCVTDGVGNYGSDESATITAVYSGKIFMKGKFRTESASYDYLTIQTVKYGGTTSPPAGIVLAAR